MIGIYLISGFIVGLEFLFEEEIFTINLGPIGIYYFYGKDPEKFERFLND